MDEIGTVPLRGPDGNFVLLRQLADIDETSGRYMILHEGARRVQTVTCNVEGRELASFVREARSRISRLSLAPDSYVEFAGAAAAESQSQRDLLVHSLLAGLGIVLLLSVVMGSFRNLAPGPGELAVCVSWWLIAAWVTGGNLYLGLAGRIRDAFRNHPAQLDHDDLSL